MQLGFVSAIFADLALPEVLRFAADEGYDCVEVMCWPSGGPDRKFGGVSHLDVVDLTPTRADEVLRLCHDTGVALSALGYYPNILSGQADESQTAVEHLKAVIRAAPMLGLNTVNTFIGNDHTRPPADNFERFLQVWPEIIRYAESHQVRIGIENCPMLFSRDEWPGGKNLARSPAIWRQMFAAIESDHFGLNYDPSHLVLQLMDPYQPLREFAPKLFHLHAKDMKIERPWLDDQGILALATTKPAWCTPKIPGLGDIDWGRFISLLTDVGYCGPICVEVEDEAFCHTLEDRKRSLRIARNVLRPLIG